MIVYRLPLIRGAFRVAQSRLAKRTRGFTFDEGLALYGWPVLRCVPGARVTVGRNLVLVSESVFSAVGVAGPCLIHAMEAGATVTIGDDVGMSGASVCCAESVTIGDRVMLGADAVVTDTDFHPVDAVPRRYARSGVRTAPVTIEDDVFVGMRAMVLKGARIGRGAVVAAGAIVTTEIPPYAIAAGQPARVVGTVDQ